MRIAFVFFGLPRSTAVTLASIQRYVLEPLYRHDISIYSCFSLQSYVASTRSGENVKLDALNYDFFARHKHEFLDVATLDDEDLLKAVLGFGDAWGDGGSSTRNLLRQLKTLSIGYELAKEESHDAYVFIRPDVRPTSLIPIETFLHRYQSQNAVLLPSWQWWNGGVNDRFAVATPASAASYAQRVGRILEYCRASRAPLHSELFLRACLKSSRTRLRTFGTHMVRVRADRTEQEEDFSHSGFRDRLDYLLAQWLRIDASVYEKTLAMTRALTRKKSIR